MVQAGFGNKRVFFGWTGYMQKRIQEENFIAKKYKESRICDRNFKKQFLIEI
jgi:hypothetical protein